MKAMTKIGILSMPHTCKSRSITTKLVAANKVKKKMVFIHFFLLCDFHFSPFSPFTIWMNSCLQSFEMHFMRMKQNGPNRN